MKVRLILARTGWDPEMTWMETRTVVVDVPYNVGFDEKQYKIIGGEPIVSATQESIEDGLEGVGNE